MDLFDSLDNLIPLLIFFIWIIGGLTSKGKKAAKTAPPSSSSRRAGTPSKPPPQSSSGGMMGELKKTLQNLFDEFQAAESQSQTEQTPVEGEGFDAVGLESSGLPSSDKGERAESLETSARREPQRSSGPPLVESPQTAARPIPLSVLRNGVIWSEILSPPVGMRM